MLQESTVVEFSAHAGHPLEQLSPLLRARTYSPLCSRELEYFLKRFHAASPRGQVRSEKDPAYSRTDPITTTSPTFATLSAQSRD